jgi:ABC-type transport system involved in multi-copper enzyme maturation permease subunit
MIVETQQLPFLEWLQSGPLIWLKVVGTLALAGLVLGYLVAAVRNGPVAALGITRRVLFSGVADLVLISPRRVWALTRLAIQDSLRRRVVIVFVVFIVVLSFAAWFLDPGSEHPLRLYISFVLTSTSYLVLLLVLFLSALSLPNDLKAKTLHTIVTKPVRPSEIVLGRMLGFTAVGTLLLVVMGLVSYLFVNRGLAHTHEVVQADLTPVGQAQAPSGGMVPMKGSSSKSHGHRHDVLVDAQGRGRLEMAQDHTHALVRTTSGDEIAYEVGPPEGLLIARVPVYGKLRFVDRERVEKEKGINVGDEWAYRSYIDGGTLAAAIWTFDDIRPEDFPERLQIEMTLGVFRTTMGNIVEGLPGSFLIRNPKTGLTVEARIFKAKEFTTDVQNLPRRIAPTNVYYLRRETIAGKEGEEPQVKYVREDADAATADKAQFDLFEDLSDNGRFEVWLQCLAPMQYFGAAQADLYLRASDASFALNFVKGYFGIWMQMVLVIAFGVMFSTFLSGPVAMIATVGALLGGLFRPFMIALATGQTAEGKVFYGGGPVESLIRILTQQNVVTEMEAGLRTTVAQTIDGVLQRLLWVMAHLLPEFGQFGSADYVAYGFNISGAWVAEHGLAALGFFVALFVVGYFFLKTREVAR